MDNDYFVENTLGEGFGVYKENFITLIVGALILGVGSVFIITAPPLIFGFYYMVQRMLRGEKAEIADIFKGSYYLTVSWKMTIEVALIMLAFFLLFTLPTLIPLVEQIPGLAPLIPFYDVIPQVLKDILAKILVVGVVFMLICSLISFIFPGTIILIVFQYAIPLSIAENLGAFPSLNKSFLVARAHMAYSILLFLFLLIIEAVVGAILACWLLIYSLTFALVGAILIGWLLVYPYSVICLSRAAQKLTEK